MIPSNRFFILFDKGQPMQAGILTATSGILLADITYDVHRGPHSACMRPSDLDGLSLHFNESAWRQAFAEAVAKEQK